MTGRFWRAEIGIFLALWLLGMAIGPAFLKDPGTFWHTVVGERILQTGELPTTDPFSCSYGGQPWMSSQFWLFEVGMAQLHRLGGLDTLVLATVTILAALYTWLAHRFLRAGLHWSLAVLLILLTIRASAYHFHPRPHLATMVLFAVTFALLVDVEAGRLRLVRLLWLIPVFILWTNLHGGMLGGFGTVGIAATGWCGLWLLGRDSPVRRWRDVGFLLGLGILLALTSLVHPAGWQAPRTWLGLMDSPVLPRYLSEHFPLDPLEPDGQSVLLLAAVYGVGLIGIGRRWPRVSWLLPLVWLILTLGRIRHGPLFAIAAALALADLLPFTLWADWLGRHSRLFQRAQADVQPWRVTHFVLPAVLVLAALGLQATGVQAPLIGRGSSPAPPEIWPVELLPQLREQEREHPGAPVLNDMYFGGFLIYYTPDMRVFIDDRCELYSTEFLRTYFEAQPHDIRRWIDQYDFPVALVQKDSALDRYLAAAADWKVAGETGSARLYRRSPP